MGGLMHVGLRNEKGGRMGDATSNVSEALKRLGFAVERFKTGTPVPLEWPIHRLFPLRTQGGDTPVPKFSFMADTSVGETTTCSP